MFQHNKELRKMFNEIVKCFSFEKYYTRKLDNKEFAAQLLFRLSIYKFFTRKSVNLYSEISDVDFKKLLSNFLIEHPIERESKRLEVMRTFLKDNFAKYKDLNFSNISDFSYNSDDEATAPDDDVIPDDEATVLKSIETILNVYSSPLKSSAVFEIKAPEEVPLIDEDILILGISWHRPLGQITKEIQKIIESKRFTKKNLFKNNGEISDADIKRLRESHILQLFDLWLLQQAYNQHLTDENIANLFFGEKSESETSKNAENIRKTGWKNFNSMVESGSDYQLLRYVHRQSKD